MLGTNTAPPAAGAGVGAAATEGGATTGRVAGTARLRHAVLLEGSKAGIPLREGLHSLYRLRRSKFIRECLEFLVFVVALLFISADLFNQRSSYKQDEALQRIMIPPYDSNMRTLDDVWNWLEDTVLPEVWSLDLYEGRPLPDNQIGNVAQYNQLVGEVELRQARVTSDSCVSRRFLKFGKRFDAVDGSCYDEFTPVRWDADSGTAVPKSGTEATEAFGPDNVWKWSRHQDTLTGEFLFGVGNYGMGGYTVLLPARNASLAADRLEFLKANGFLDRSTRALMMQATTYNTNTKLLQVLRITIELFPEGLISWSHAVGTARVLMYEDRSDIVRAVAEGIWLFLLLHWTVREVRRFMDTHPRVQYIKEFRNVFELVYLSLAWSLGITWVLYVADARRSAFDVQATGSAALWPLVEHYRLCSDIAGAALLMSSFKVTKYLALQKRMAILFATLKRSGYDLVLFMVGFFTLIAGFALAGNLVFGASIRQFHDFGASMSTLMQFALGSIEYEPLSRARPEVAPIFTYAFLLLVYLSASSVFVAIITLHLEVVHRESLSEDTWKEGLPSLTYETVMHVRRWGRRLRRRCPWCYTLFCFTRVVRKRRRTSDAAKAKASGRARARASTVASVKERMVRLLRQGHDLQTVIEDARRYAAARHRANIASKSTLRPKLPERQSSLLPGSSDSCGWLCCCCRAGQHDELERDRASSDPGIDASTRNGLAGASTASLPLTTQPSSGTASPLGLMGDSTAQVIEDGQGTPNSVVAESGSLPSGSRAGSTRKLSRMSVGSRAPAASTSAVAATPAPAVGAGGAAAAGSPTALPHHPAALQPAAKVDDLDDFADTPIPALTRDVSHTSLHEAPMLGPLRPQDKMLPTFRELFHAVRSAQEAEASERGEEAADASSLQMRVWDAQEDFLDMMKLAARAARRRATRSIDLFEYFEQAWRESRGRALYVTLNELCLITSGEEQCDHSACVARRVVDAYQRWKRVHLVRGGEREAGVVPGSDSVRFFAIKVNSTGAKQERFIVIDRIKRQLQGFDMSLNLRRVLPLSQLVQIEQSNVDTSRLNLVFSDGVGANWNLLFMTSQERDRFCDILYDVVQPRRGSGTGMLGLLGHGAAALLPTAISSAASLASALPPGGGDMSIGMMPMTPYRSGVHSRQDSIFSSDSGALLHALRMQGGLPSPYDPDNVSSGAMYPFEQSRHPTIIGAAAASDSLRRPSPWSSGHVPQSDSESKQFGDGVVRSRGPSASARAPPAPPRRPVPTASAGAAATTTKDPSSSSSSSNTSVPAATAAAAVGEIQSLRSDVVRLEHTVQHLVSLLAAQHQHSMRFEGLPDPLGPSLSAGLSARSLGIGSDLADDVTRARMLAGGAASSQRSVLMYGADEDW